ncbi:MULTISPECIES: hypothetical protein [Streptomyces]|uniref:Integral membrane protein n=1 Tax=Streptomyces lycii TaxID=2654337 RepID=A0ABQ7F8Y7_9ACTN|nr:MULTISPECIES: hypothetical protein [Streptomyces]KAF4405087.1 hypothetical protein GCU69_32080 [Streptomyces lycii]PGH48868.1 hypothetical protein CRI70_20720 [Streptomyces sp. Ru87]
MFLLRRQLTALLRDGGAGVELHTMVNPWASRRKFAAFAYIAEQYGYRYDGLASGIPTSRSHPIFGFRRLPDAQERATRTSAAYPNAVGGGPYPGMRPSGNGLTPLPEARPEVDLLHARIMTDLYGESSTGRIKMMAIVIPVSVLLGLVLTGNFTTTGTLIGGCVVAGFWLYLWLAAAYMRRRRVKYVRILERAGIAWPPRRSDR